MSFNKPIHRIAIVGTGVIGASWAAQYLARGFDVVATDPAPNAEANLRKYVDEAWEELEAIGLSPGASRDRLSFTAGHEGGAGAGRLRPGKRPRAARVQDQALRRHGRRHACRLDHRVELLGDHAERDAVEVQAPRARPRRASVQPAAHHSARGSRRRSEDLAGSDPDGDGVLRVDRQEADSLAEGASRAMSRTACKRRSIARCSTSSSKAC